ncbi:MAG: hypothetical protein OEY20_08290 [Gemmatimonadota bacterium]|nr:hypothetical protein [Gemmatimonadota bacterium]
MQHSQSHQTTVVVLLLIAAACGGGEPPKEEAPRGLTTTPSSAAPIPITVSADLTPGTCEPASGAIVNRPGLSGITVVIEPGREIVALFDSGGSLAIYRDQVIGRNGYTVRLDMAVDSASVLDRATRTITRGTVSEFRTRSELGPPDAIAAQALARCGQQGGRR